MPARRPSKARARAVRPVTGFKAGGLTLSADTATILVVASARERLFGQVVDALGRHIPVAIRVQQEGNAVQRARQFECFCVLLAAALRAAGMSGRGLELTCAASDVAAAHAWETRQRLLGPGILNVLLDAEAVGNAVLLLELWRLRHENLLRVGISPLVKSACSLLVSEKADHLLPDSGIQVPAETAWLTSSLDAGDYYHARDGTIALEALQSDAVRMLDDADERFDKLRWPTAAMQQDAWLNRRIVIRLHGVGKLVAGARLDPAQLSTLQQLADALRAVRSALVQRSMQIARHAETLPAIAAGSPQYKGAQSDLKAAWQKRWIDAVRRSALRHRNLLVMSPWSLFPAASADIRYLNLLPLLALADAHEFRREFSIACWNFNNFNNFYRRTRASLCACDSNYVVAERL